MKFNKGDILEAVDPFIVVPIDSGRLPQSIIASLPRFDDRGDLLFSTRPPWIEEHVKKILSIPHGSFEVSIIVCLDLVQNGKHIIYTSSTKSDCFGVVDCEETKPLVVQSWNLVESKISLKEWISLVNLVLQRIYVISIDGPLHHYASVIVPTLNSVERTQVVELLNLPRNSSNSSLQLMTQVSSLLPTQLVAALFLVPFKYPHSCCPTLKLELSRDGKGQVVALYAIDVGEEATLCVVQEDDDVELREEMVRVRTGNSCCCLRCLYELNQQSFLSNLSKMEAVRLGRFYLAKADTDTAKKLFTLANSIDGSDLDVWHALGAIELSSGSFLKAQRLWYQAPKGAVDHAGIALEVTKMKSYLSGSTKAFLVQHYTERKWTSPLPNTFVTSLLDVYSCKQIIAWAEGGIWTKQRHYDVPTNDVPVHTVEPLLKWFNNFMQDVVRPLLACQFETTGNYYVHDAFCVRYQSGGTANHLPVHTDESTHSFVLALNEGYTGGGTLFYDFDKVVKLRTGEILTFRGDTLWHGGDSVESGVRYILAAFLYHDDDKDKPGAVNTKRRIVATDEVSTKRTAFHFDFAVDKER